MRTMDICLIFLGFAVAIMAGCGGKPPQAEHPVRTIVFFGDSLTWGFGVDREAESYVARIDRITQALYENVRTVNAGTNGDTSSDALARFQTDVIAHDPDFVVLEFGLNDCRTSAIPPEAFRANIEAMIGRIPTGAQVFLATSPAFLEGGGLEWENLNDSLDRYMDVLRDIARERGLTLIDVHRAWGNRIRSDLRNMESMYLDPSHPSAKGHDFIYDLHMDALRRKLTD